MLQLEEMHQDRFGLGEGDQCCVVPGSHNARDGTGSLIEKALGFRQRLTRASVFLRMHTGYVIGRPLIEVFLGKTLDFLVLTANEALAGLKDRLERWPL